MNSKTLDAITVQLQEQKDKTAAKADTLRCELAALDEDIARFDAAIAALNGTPLAVANGKSHKKLADKKKVLAPAPSRAQVVDLMAATLLQCRVMPEEELKISIEKQLVDAGHNRMGLSLRFKEALADARFIIDERGVGLTRRLHESHPDVRLEVAPAQPSKNGELGSAKITLHT